MTLMFLSYFFLGFSVGSIVTIFSIRSKIKKIYDRELKFVEETIKTLKSTVDNASVRERLKKSQDLTKKQLELFSAIDMPQKNALDGKYKQQLNDEIKLIEEQKIEILSSILNDGFDPVITIINEKAQNENIKLSEFFKMRSLDPRKYAKDAGPVPPPKKIGKFTVYTGGNDSGGMVH